MSSAVLRRLATTCRSVPTFSYGRSFSTSSSLLADSNSNANAEGGVQTVTLIPGRISIGICLHDLVFLIRWWYWSRNCEQCSKDLWNCRCWDQLGICWCYTSQSCMLSFLFFLFYNNNNFLLLARWKISNSYSSYWISQQKSYWS